MAARLNWDSDWPAPAKINLFLHVIGRRADGYHLLQTVFRFLDVGDHLRFAPRDDGVIAQNSPLPGVAPEQDLTVRAARALQAASGVRQGVSITLAKHLPLGGGLGGGSSDAATTLLALNHLWQCGLSRTDLSVIGLRLGADVPVFIHGHSAFGEGVGERLTDVSPPPAWYLLLAPPVAVSTAEIFNAADLRRDTSAIVPGAWQSDFGVNDLEAVTCRRYPEVARHLAWLRTLDGASRVAMSGSGACCFAEFGTESAARTALARLPYDMRGFVARGVDVHPLAQM
ncbi:4-diphosphocytidyl-2-C-methylerythritol kinase [Georgfuchsia toluolica]|uniref:4-diphosphocytidyl-2-C-methyl-D-erythritol kinase n=1 Tax=Georgfuchsia toluolica TaxID=424218 RepID=A0A916J5U7_9PROT|nr:4-(cytidine 5'-diphospho)-2-C-methyl-D-erythritol kinase [Georgfuchsia toluolica]CAG4884538.1 4-diphosphocytidyl-2-C-methylerythritol kinase [Georgfuchsia toluolica]